jgi:5-methylcytosine-specific restriction enzyme subunit McrC
MESLFETYVTTLLKKSAKRTPFKVSSQKSKHFWRGSERGLKTVRPDILIDWTKDSRTRRVVLDTKWKVPNNNIPGDSDLKQMFVYNKLFNSEASNLVYPAVNSSTTKNGQFVGLNNGHCSMWYVQILDKEMNSLNHSLGDEILQKLSLDGNRP